MVGQSVTTVTAHLSLDFLITTKTAIVGQVVWVAIEGNFKELAGDSLAMESDNP